MIVSFLFTSHLKLFLQGVLKPENIIIHVAQNFVNFVSSSAAWSFISFMYPKQNNGRSADAQPEYYDHQQYQQYQTQYKK